MLIQTKGTDRKGFGSDAFRILRTYPGLHYGDTNDRGIAGLGCIDHSKVKTDFTVKMHEHKNDEILSYIRRGLVAHVDKREHSDPVLNSSTHLMLMNAGKSFWHEEKTLGEDDLINMQIFVRPAKANLEPKIQFYHLASEKSEGTWRLIAGPEHSAAPLKFRSEVTLFDAYLNQASLLTPDVNGLCEYLYIVSGAATMNENEYVLSEGDGLIIKDAQVEIYATDAADILLFMIDESAHYSREGTISG